MYFDERKNCLPPREKRGRIYRGDPGTQKIEGTGIKERQRWETEKFPSHKGVSMAEQIQEKSAFIAIVGRPNVGKSSLLNRMLGQKVAIVSSKPQTTRTRIMGILTQKETQLVFIDTPGLHKPRTRLGDYMVKSVSESVAGVDACLLVVEAGRDIAPAEEELMKKFQAMGLPAVLAINKIDLLEDKSAPVSYTHLDVYKRQGWETVENTSDVLGEICRSTPENKAAIPPCKRRNAINLAREKEIPLREVKI